MGNTIYSFVNLIKEAYDSANTNLNPSSQNSIYTKANLVDNKASKPFKFNSSGDGNIVMDLENVFNIRIFSIINHNIPETAVITIDYGNTIDGFPNQPETLTWNEINIYHVFSADRAYRYWKLDLSNIGSVVVYIGEIWLGEMYLLPTPDFNMNLTKAIDVYVNKTHYGITRELARGRYNSLNLRWDLLTPDDFTSIQNFYNYVKYNIESRNEFPIPFIFILDLEHPNDNNKSLFCRVSNELSLQQQTYIYYKSQSEVILTEEPRGFII